jgi:hypothetical protein
VVFGKKDSMIRAILSSVFFVAIISLFAVACNKSSVEGKYTLDKAAMKKAVEDKIASMPKDKQGMAKLGLAMIDQVDMSLDLKKGGEAEFATKMMGKSDSAKGKWENKDGNITITAGGEDKKLSCKLDGNKLTCDKGKEALVFVKQ